MTQQKLIDQIHSEFDTAQERLLNEANKVLSTVNHSVVNISERLKAIGFINTPTAKKGAEVKDQLVKSKEEAELIQYYATNYPFLKFLTESELDRICTKYNLVYSPIERYIKDVPEKNLKDIESAQSLSIYDKTEVKTYFSGEVWCASDLFDLRKTLKEKCRNLVKVPFKQIDKEEGKFISDETRIALGVLKSLGIHTNIRSQVWIDGSISTLNLDGLFIAAPESHFNTEGLTKKGLGFFQVFKTEVKDPIVFRYVRGGVQVITKWGLEANDPSLVVPKLN